PPTVVTQPLGRFSRPGIDPGPAGERTLLGVPAAPALEVNLESGVFPGERPTSTGAATPPPLPRSTQRQGASARPLQPQQMTAQLPPVSKAPDARRGQPPPSPAAPPSVRPDTPGPRGAAPDRGRGGGAGPAPRGRGRGGPRPPRRGRRP